MIGLIDAVGLDHDSDDDQESLGVLQMEGARASDDFTSFSSIVDDVCGGFSEKTRDMVSFVQDKIQNIVQTPNTIQDIVPIRNQMQDIVPRRAASVSSFSNDLDEIFEECGEIETEEIAVTPARKPSTLMKRIRLKLSMITIARWILCLAICPGNFRSRR